ncbi:MAG: ABC transporter permease [Acidipila sp.]|nr:ABC transporter permease [Acidipila sp.]
MFFRIVGESFSRNPLRKWLAAVALVLGMAITTAALTVALDVGDRLAREFRAFGANLVVSPTADTLPLEIGGVDYRPVEEGSYLPEADLGKLKTIFWRHNIIGFSPFLEVPAILERDSSGPAIRTTLTGTWVNHSVAIPDGTIFQTGVLRTHPWWKVEGAWFDDSKQDCVVGAGLAARTGLKPGDTVTLRFARAGLAPLVQPGQTPSEERHVSMHVTGILSTGGTEEQVVMAPLAVVQALTGRTGEFRRLMVSALTRPEDEFSRRDPSTMSKAEYDRWFCAPYISSIALQIRQVLPGADVQVIRQVAEGEGRILTRITALMWLVCIAALLAAGLVVGATAATSVLERHSEIGLMKALGAPMGTVSALFLAEQLVLAFVGGGLGYVAGEGLAYLMGQAVFGVPATGRLILLPVILLLAAAVVLAGSLIPLGRVARLDPAPVLRGE